MVECYFTLDWKGSSGINTLTYWAHLRVRKIMKCCEYGPSALRLFAVVINTGLLYGAYYRFLLPVLKHGIVLKNFLCWKSILLGI
jgi:hypothetical protein